ncbi:Reverse transcriptase domain [Trinorchestia longiramus]|nr:Reverse transcriptase domain [Trinorchestia longiramus]
MHEYLLDFFGEVNRIYDCTNPVDLVYLDFHRAFDKVAYERLMAKVEAHGIRSHYSRWLRNWFTGRTEQEMIHDQASDLMHVTSGVPQGNVLGPLLFLTYINDHDLRIISKINKFADYMKLCSGAFTETDRITIQSGLNRLLQWTEIRKMSFNIDKCPVMHVGANNSDSAPSHGSNVTQTWIPWNIPSFVSKDVWTARGPDLNPLDFFIWFILETRVLATPHTFLESLKAKLQREWEAIPQKQIRAACDAFVNRLKPVVRTKGGSIE